MDMVRSPRRFSPRPDTQTRLKCEPLESREVPAFGLDPTFGSGGLALDPFGTQPPFVAGVAAAPGGAIVAAGNVVEMDPIGEIVAVARVTATGAVDPSFGGGDGRITLSFPNRHLVSTVAVQPDGKVLV